MENSNKKSTTVFQKSAIMKTYLTIFSGKTHLCSFYCFNIAIFWEKAKFCNLCATKILKINIFAIADFVK